MNAIIIKDGIPCFVESWPEDFKWCIGDCKEETLDDCSCQIRQEAINKTKADAIARALPIVNVWDFFTEKFGKWYRQDNGAIICEIDSWPYPWPGTVKTIDKYYVKSLVHKSHWIEISKTDFGYYERDSQEVRKEAIAVELILPTQEKKENNLQWPSERSLPNEKRFHELSELLAVMHGDGGHHESKVGTIQAVKDAMELLHTKWIVKEEVSPLVSPESQRKLWNEILVFVDSPIFSDELLKLLQEKFILTRRK
jgi:hypothetical protein